MFVHVYVSNIRSRLGGRLPSNSNDIGLIDGFALILAVYGLRKRVVDNIRQERGGEVFLRFWLLSTISLASLKVRVQVRLEMRRQRGEESEGQRWRVWSG